MDRAFVICVDDDPDILALLGDALSLFGFAFLGLPYPSILPSSATRPTPHADVIFRNCPDVLIVDLMLRGPEDGIELTERLRKSGLSCPTIALSASNHMLEIARDSQLFAACLAKPIDIFTLRTEIDQLTQKSEPVQTTQEKETKE